MDFFEFAKRGMKAQAEVDKLCRRDGPETSRDAAEKMVESGALNQQEEGIYEAIKEYVRCHTKEDFTTKDIALFMSNNSYHRDYDICRKRFSGLRDKGKIELVYEKKGPHISINRIVKRRDGCRVWRLK